MGYYAYKLTEESRNLVVTASQPLYSYVLCNEIIILSNTTKLATPPPNAKHFFIVGYAGDNRGLECWILEINGKTTRPDGYKYHLILSRASGRQVDECNRMIATYGWTRDMEPLAISVESAEWYQ